jgi:hypothetical protein
MNIRVIELELAQGTADALIGEIDGSLLPILAVAEGFVAYYVLKVADDHVLTVRVFSDETTMEAANQASSTVVAQLTQTYGITSPTSYSGDLGVAAGFGWFKIP